MKKGKKRRQRSEMNREAKGADVLLIGKPYKYFAVILVVAGFIQAIILESRDAMELEVIVGVKYFNYHAVTGIFCIIIGTVLLLRTHLLRRITVKLSRILFTFGLFQAIFQIRFIKHLIDHAAGQGEKVFFLYSILLISIPLIIQTLLIVFFGLLLLANSKSEKALENHMIPVITGRKHEAGGESGKGKKGEERQGEKEKRGKTSDSGDHKK